LATKAGRPCDLTFDRPCFESIERSGDFSGVENRQVSMEWIPLDLDSSFV